MNCDACGQPGREDEMMQFEGRWICAACKPAFVQRLKEGCLSPVAPPLPEGFEERVLGHWELVTLSWRLIRQDWLAIGALVLMVSVPINLILSATNPGEWASWQEIGRNFRLSQFLETLFGVLASLGIAKIVSERVQGRQLGFWGGLSHALRRWLPGVGTGFLEGIIIGFLTLALIVPGIIWSGYYCFSTGVVSLRDRAGKSALDYSKSLVRGFWWGVVGRVLTLTVMALVPVVAVEIGTSFAPSFPGLSAATDIMTDLCVAFVSVGVTVLFLNLDAIKHRSPAFNVPELPR